MRTLSLILSVCLLLAVPVGTAAAADVDLLLNDTSAGKTIFHQHLAAGSRFTLIYRHSVEKSLVDEIYEVAADGSIYLVETTVRASGYGLPECAPGENCISHDDAVTFPGLHLKIDDLIMRVSYLNDMWLKFEETAVNLPKIAPGGHRIQVKARPVDAF